MLSAEIVEGMGNKVDKKSLTYGEISVASFYKILGTIGVPMRTKKFYDLGSGTGKAIVVARFATDFDVCIGIELLPSLHAMAEAVHDRMKKKKRSRLNDMLQMAEGIELHKGSFLDFDWSSGDLVFANSTCFSKDLMQNISAQAEKLAPGAILICFTKPIASNCFELLHKRSYKMSWGPASVYTYRRRYKYLI
jgi:SAM-dependent methyltransferase